MTSLFATSYYGLVRKLSVFVILIGVKNPLSFLLPSTSIQRTVKLGEAFSDSTSGIKTHHILSNRA